MYIGIQMANGLFWGEHYPPGDYTTFIIGIIWLVAGAITLFVLYKRERKSEEENILEETGKEENEKPAKTSLVSEIIRGLSIICAVIGIFTLIAGFSKDNAYIFIGLSVIFLALILYGFSYLIEAAIIYIKNHHQ